MGLFVNTNMQSINTQRAMNSSTGKLSRTFQRLSTGMRINSARDDAAGLAISTRFNAQVRGLTQAVRNTNDGISLVQTVEGALQETTSILQRMRELSVQAANDVNTAADRKSINAEVSQLIDELNRISEATTFNDQQVLNGDFVQGFFHVGHKANETLSVAVKDASARSLGRAAVHTTGEVTGDALNKGNGDLLINGITVRSTTATDDTVSTSLATASAIAKAAAINDGTDFSGVSARALETVRAPNGDVQGGQLDSDSYITLNGVTITDFAVQEDDSDNALQNQINAVSDQTGVIASLDADSRLVLTAVDGRNIHVDVSDADASAITGLAVGETVEFAAIELQSEKQFEITGANVGFVGFAGDRIIGVNNNNSVQTVDVLSRSNANRSLEVIDRALEQVSGQRSKLGALHNRFESTIRNLNTMNENISASKSRVTDADFAKESAELARNQILQQAASTILAQANQSSQVALSLLG